MIVALNLRHPPIGVVAPAATEKARVQRPQQVKRIGVAIQRTVGTPAHRLAQSGQQFRDRLVIEHLVMERALSLLLESLHHL